MHPNQQHQLSSNGEKVHDNGAAKKVEDPRQLGEDVATMFTKLTTFGDRPDLLLGISLVKALQNFGVLFANSELSIIADRKAVRVEKLHAFVSHNWVVLRSTKFLALTFHFNSLPAVVVCCFVTAMLLVWQSFGSGPVVLMSYISERKVGFLCRLLFVPLFFGVTFFGRRFVATLGFQTPMLFVDKACINQDDPTEMRLGIEKLAAFLRCSSQMVVLYTDVYLTKLWTVYEIAAFLVLKPIDSLRIVPVSLPICFYSLLILSWFQNLLRICIDIYGIPSITIDLMTAVVCGQYAFTLRKWVCDKEQIKHRLTNFEVRDTLCAVEDDRPLIFGNISTLMQNASLCPLGCSLDEALDAFNMKVRTDLPKAFNMLLGNVSFDYMSLVLVSTCVIGLHPLDASFVTLTDGLLRSKLTDVPFTLVGVLITIPFFFGLLEICLSYQLHLRGMKEIGWVVAVNLCLGTIAFTMSTLMSELEARAYTSDVYLTAMLSISLCFFCVAGVAWCYFVKKRYHRQMLWGVHEEHWPETRSRDSQRDNIRRAWASEKEQETDAKSRCPA